MKGYFVVYRDPEDARDIYFEQIELDSNEKVPDEQIDLVAEIGQVVAILQTILDANKYQRRFIALLSLAQVGVSGESAQPKLARRMLELLQMEVVDSEGGRIKNRYMKRLGLEAAVFALIGIAASLLGAWLQQQTLTHYGVIWAGCMLGVWLSFGIRRVAMSFETLHVIESDHLTPGIRLIFAGLLTLVLALILQVGLFAFQIGNFDSSSFPYSLDSSLLFGVLSGISEKALSDKVAVSARQFLKQGS